MEELQVVRGETLHSGLWEEDLGEAEEMKVGMSVKMDISVPCTQQALCHTLKLLFL